MHACAVQGSLLRSVTILAVFSHLVHTYVITITPTQALTCWTCPNKTDNEACNTWAPDVHCPTNHTVCQTLHRVDTQRRSILVHKSCAKVDECTQDHVGCVHTDSGVMECMSCCTDSYCNEAVPSNHSSAIMLSATVFSHAHRTEAKWRQTPTLVLPLLLVLSHLHPHLTSKLAIS